MDVVCFLMTAFLGLLLLGLFYVTVRDFDDDKQYENPKRKKDNNLKSSNATTMHNYELEHKIHQLIFALTKNYVIPVTQRLNKENKDFCESLKR